MVVATLAQFSGTYGHVGNDKVGKHVSIVNREAGATCPGESEFCADFDTVEYIHFAIEVVRNNPDTRFWAYTRSWNVPELLPHLETLRAIPNMQLFASCDTTMPMPPEDWRVGYIIGDDRFRGMPCLEQACSKECPTDCVGNPRKGHVSKMPDCETCGYCPIKTRGNVGFYLH